VRLLNTSNVKLTDVDDCLKTAEEFIKNNQWLCRRSVKYDNRRHDKRWVERCWRQ
jgi:hypothetical protein